MTGNALNRWESSPNPKSPPSSVDVPPLHPPSSGSLPPPVTCDRANCCDTCFIALIPQLWLPPSRLDGPIEAQLVVLQIRSSTLSITNRCGPRSRQTLLGSDLPLQLTYNVTSCREIRRSAVWRQLCHLRCWPATQPPLSEYTIFDFSKNVWFFNFCKDV